MNKINYNDFKIGYFPSYDKYYISNGTNTYLDKQGDIGKVTYYKTLKETENLLKKLQAKTDCDDCASKDSCPAKGERCNDYVLNEEDYIKNYKKYDEEDFDEEEEDNECKKCGCTMTIPTTPYDLEPTDYCNLCAQDLLVKLQEIIEIISRNIKAGTVSITWIENFIDKQMLELLKKDNKKKK